MCHKNCCNHTQHAIIFFIILSLLLLPNAPNINIFLNIFANNNPSSRPPSSHATEGDVGLLTPPCTTTKLAMAFLYGVVFTFVIMIVSNNLGTSSPKSNNDINEEPLTPARGAHSSRVGPPRRVLVGGPIDDQGGAEGGGVGFALLRTFPTFAYSVRRPPKFGKGTSVCVICQFKFKDEELVRWLPDCDHLFHLSCIDEWLTSHKTCPCCRTDLNVTTTHGSSSNGTSTSSSPTFIYEYFNEYYYNVFSR